MILSHYFQNYARTMRDVTDKRTNQIDWTMTARRKQMKHRKSSFAEILFDTLIFLVLVPH